MPSRNRRTGLTTSTRGDRSSEPPRNPAFRQYRDRALALRTFSETHVGTTWDYVAVGRWGPYGYHTGWRPWPRPYLVRTTFVPTEAADRGSSRVARNRRPGPDSL